MSLIDMLFGRKPKTATVARDRLQIIIAQERAQEGQAPDYLPTLRKELLEVPVQNTSTYHWTTSASPKRNKTAWTFLS